MIYAAEMMQKNLPLRFIAEWVEWHDYIGFDKLYVLDHFSEKRLEYSHPKLKIFHATSHLDEMNRFPNIGSPQFKYNAMSWWWQYLINYERWDWMAFIDSDEFVMFDKGNSLPNLLKGDAVALNWKNFGPDDYEKDPDNTLKSYTKCSRHHATKVIAKKSALVADHDDVQNCHLPALKPEAVFVNSSGRELPHRPYTADEAYHQGFSSWDDIWINHYHLRSREDWFRKQKSMVSTNKSEMPWYWEEEHFQGCRKAAEIDTTAIEHDTKDYSSNLEDPQAS